MKTLVKTLVLCLCALLVLAPMSMAEVSITEPGAMPVVNEPAELNIFLFTSTAAVSYTHLTLPTTRRV